jgi:hypothetical protein
MGKQPRPLLVSKNNNILAHVNTECLDDRYPKLKMYTLEMILDWCEYIPVAYVTIHCMI